MNYIHSTTLKNLLENQALKCLAYIKVVSVAFMVLFPPCLKNIILCHLT